MTEKHEVPAPLELPRPTDIEMAETARHMHFIDALREKHKNLSGPFSFPTLVLEAAGQEPGDLLEIPVKRAVVLAYMIGLQLGAEPFREKSPV